MKSSVIDIEGLPPFTTPVLIYQHEEPQGVIIVLPAMGTKAGYYEPFAEALVERGYSVLVAEIPGTGTSKPRPSRAVDYAYRDLFRKWLPAVVRQARDLAGGAPVTIVGHSLGGHIAMLGVRSGSIEVDAVITIASGHIHWKNWQGAGAAQVFFASMLFPSLTYLLGYLPGQHLGFGGPQARTLIRQWARMIRGGQLDHIAEDLAEDVQIP